MYFFRKTISEKLRYKILVYFVVVCIIVNLLVLFVIENNLVESTIMSYNIYFEKNTNYQLSYEYVKKKDGNGSLDQGNFKVMNGIIASVVAKPKERPTRLTADAGPKLEETSSRLMNGHYKLGLKSTIFSNVTYASDEFSDLMNIVSILNENNTSLKKMQNNQNPNIGEILGLRLKKNSTLLEKFHFLISRDWVYPPPEEDDTVELLLQHMATQPIARVDFMVGGSQLKRKITFTDGSEALFKPMRSSRKQQRPKNRPYFKDFERPNAEIAAFHLDRILKLRRSFPVTGRIFNVTSDLYAHATEEALKTFYTSPQGDLCFFHSCNRGGELVAELCGPSNGVCADGGLLEGSLTAFFPPTKAAVQVVYEYPFMFIADLWERAPWQEDGSFCDNEVKPQELFKRGRALLDMVDMSIFDFLIGNMDRHHYHIFKMFDEQAYPIHFDNGKGFQRPDEDDLDILAALTQCCVIRHSTLITLLQFQTGAHTNASLSSTMRRSLSRDPIAPVLWEPHLDALERRLSLVLQEVRQCVQRNIDPASVITDDSR